MNNLSIIVIIVSAHLLTLTTVQAQSASAFQPGKEWPDNHGIHINAHGGGVLWHNGNYYWFGEHKVAGEKGNRAYVGVHCYTSKDLHHWVDSGIVLAVDGAQNSPIAPGAIIERPKVIYNKKNKQFIMWFHLELKDQGYKAALCGVATSKKITGPYVFHHAERPDKGTLPISYKPDTNKGDSILLRDKEKGQMSRDMNLFVDEDNSAYLIYTSEENRTVHISQLSDDYLSTRGRFARVFPDRFMEAAAIFKANGKYFFVASGCTGWAPNAARSAVATHIFGPWQELGNPCEGPDSALTFHGQSTFVLPVMGTKNTFIFMADKWNPKNAIDGRYLWLPVVFKANKFKVMWSESWELEDQAKQKSINNE